MLSGGRLEIVCLIPRSHDQGEGKGISPPPLNPQEEGMIHRLKCKIGALGAEAQIIRTYERHEKNFSRRRRKKQKPNNLSLFKLNDMRKHRVHVVRVEARHALLAYGFLRGKTYRQLENGNTKTVPSYKGIARLARRFSEDKIGKKDMRQKVKTWIEAEATE